MSIQEVKARIDEERAQFKAYVNETLGHVRDHRAKCEDPEWRKKVNEARGEFLKEEYRKEMGS